MGKGIDYGMGTTNIDRETGIRFGVFNANWGDLSDWFWESVESDYGEPTCGWCGNPAVEYDDDRHGEYRQGPGCSDYACEDCGRVFDSCDAYSEEPVGFAIDDDGVIATGSAGDNDFFVTRSPYFTRAQYCSPCAPGACHLENPDPDGERAYCLGHDWFRDGAAPYPVYSVETGELIPPPVK